MRTQRAPRWRRSSHPLLALLVLLGALALASTQAHALRRVGQEVGMEATSSTDSDATVGEDITTAATDSPMTDSPMTDSPVTDSEEGTATSSTGITTITTGIIAESMGSEDDVVTVSTDTLAGTLTSSLSSQVEASEVEAGATSEPLEDAASSSSVSGNSPSVELPSATDAVDVADQATSLASSSADATAIVVAPSDSDSDLSVGTVAPSSDSFDSQLGDDKDLDFDDDVRVTPEPPSIPDKAGDRQPQSRPGDEQHEGVWSSSSTTEETVKGQSYETSSSSKDSSTQGLESNARASITGRSLDQTLVVFILAGVATIAVVVGVISRSIYRNMGHHEEEDADL